jgi:hypothetical protein
MQRAGKQVIAKEDLLKFLSIENDLLANNNKYNNSHDNLNDFDWFIEWGRQALILKYDANNETIRLRDKL